MEKIFYNNHTKNTFLALCPGCFFTKDLHGVYTSCNEAMALCAGLNTPQDIVGKNDYDMPWREYADSLRANDKTVMQSRKEVTLEEIIKSSKGEVVSYVVNKKPIYDDENIVIGISGIAIDMTEREQYEKNLILAKEKAEKETKNALLNLEQIVASMPGSVFWKNCEGVYLGLNDELADMIGLPKKEILGKTDYQLTWAPEIAKAFVQKDQEVILSGRPKLNFEEPPFKLSDGRTISQLVNKVPLRNEEGEVVGIVGIGIDITHRKRAEAEATQLKIENATHKAELEAQAKFTLNAYSVAHDIRSPLSTLLMIVKNCKELPENERIALRETTVSIADIANNLLTKYGTKATEDSMAERKPLLLSAELLHLLSDKKYQYKDKGHRFDHQFNQMSHLVFIHIQPSSFKRMISNLINNAVDAFEDKKGEVTVKLEASNDKVFVSICDNGKGMPSHVIDKIMQNIAVTAGKADGHGLGLTQVREALSRNEGKMSIESEINQGTQIKLTFPRIQAPNWIVEAIRIRVDDTVVILDDDKSIHMAWDMRFEDILKKYPQIKVHHFENCHDAIHFIESLTEDEKQTVYLLTDYELLKQELNGLHVVEKTKIKRSVLVTSHYANDVVLSRSQTLGTKILPKQLTPEISIIVDESTPTGIDTKAQAENLDIKAVDAVLVDDDRRFAEMLMRYVFGGNAIDYFEDPHEFMGKIKSYPKNTRIYLDNNYLSAGVTGFTLAKELHEQGYTTLYLLTGDTFEPGQAPDYVKVIRKDDIDNIKDWEN